MCQLLHRSLHFLAVLCCAAWGGRRSWTANFATVLVKISYKHIKEQRPQGLKAKLDANFWVCMRVAVFCFLCESERIFSHFSQPPFLFYQYDQMTFTFHFSLSVSTHVFTHSHPLWSLCDHFKKGTPTGNSAVNSSCLLPTSKQNQWHSITTNHYQPRKSTFAQGQGFGSWIVWWKPKKQLWYLSRTAI